ncbi:hypothetical protein BGZ46_001303 [Entomortierella lignicola]|nr:hypothetical protein BGZ46_001303 [Entomortierella lignicola]
MPPHQESLSFGRSFRRKRLAPIVISSAPAPATVKPKPKPTTTQPVTKSSVISTSTIPTSIPSTISINRSPTFHATSSSSSPTTVPLPGSDNGTNSSRSTNITGIVVGVALGIVVVVFVALGLIFKQRRRRRRQSKDLVKAEQYQQQRMTGDNASEVSTSGRSRSQDHNYGNRRVGSSYIEPAPSYNGKNPMNIEVGMEGNEIDSLHMNQEQKRYSQSRQGQPDWWGKKSPLEYFQQVPPVEVLYRTEEDIPKPKQQRVQNDEGQDSTKIEAARNLVSSVDHHPTNIQESIPLHVTQGTDGSIRIDSEEDAKRQSLNHTLSPQRQEQHLKPKEYQQLQQQQPQQQQRLLPIRAFSPLGVEFDEPKETDRVTSVYYPPPPVNPSTNPYYLPPPPTNFSAPSPGPRSRISTLPTEPSPGFYDSLMEGEDIEVPMSPPPPIPKATRPISTSLPTMIALAVDQDLPRFQIDEVSSTQPIQSNSNISLNSPPSLMHFDSGRVEGSREASVESPVERSNSDMSESFYGSNEPRMGGRMPRIAH